MDAPGPVPLLVIGAGPYGLSTAAHAKRHGIEPLVVGDPMGFWRRNMPQGMLLRSGTDWHLDAEGIDTFEAFLAERGIDPAEVPPVPLQTFLDYADWFCARTGIDPRPTMVSRLDEADGRFLVSFDDGRRLTAAAVVAAPGIACFPVVPDWVELRSPRTAGRTPARSRSSRTCEAPACSSWVAARARSSGRPSSRRPARRRSTWCIATIRPASRHPTGSSSTT